MTKKIITIIFFLLILSQKLMSAQDSVKNEFNHFIENTFEVGAGLGYEFNQVGFKVNYILSNQWSIMASFSPSRFQGPLYAGGIEIRFPKFLGDKYCPYLTSSYGIHHALSYSRLNSAGKYFTEVFTFSGLQISSGVKFGISTKFRLHVQLGISFRPFNNQVQNKFDDLEATYNSEYPFNDVRKDFYQPILGLIYGFI